MPKPMRHPYADDEATRMLERALYLAKEKSGVSLTDAASAIGISKAALSHMAIGRAPIPIDRAPDLAKHLQIEPRMFLMAVLFQRHPEAMEIVTGGLFASQEKESHSNDLSPTFPLSRLTGEQTTIIREVARDPHPRERWLAVSEVPVITAIRRARPSGVNQDDIETIEFALCAINPSEEGDA